MRQNLGLEVQRYVLQASQQARDARRRSYEPLLSGSYQHREAQTPPQTSQEGAAGEILERTDNVWTLGVGQRLPTGTRLQLDLRSSWERSSLGTAVRPDLFRSETEARLTQPLLRGFSLDSDVPAAEVLRAEFASERSLAEMQVAAADTLRTTERAYWDLFQAFRTYQIRLGSLELARRQLDLTDAQIQSGLLPLSDRIAAEGTLARRELALVQAEEAVGRAADELRRLMNVSGEQWRRPILPLDEPVFAEVAADLDVLVARAQSQRPELMQSAADVRRAELDLRVAENNRLPQLDVNLGYGLIGQDETYGSALDRMVSTRGRYWSASANFSLAPLGLEASSEQSRASTVLSRVRVQRDQLLQTVRLEVHHAVRALATATRQVRVAESGRVLAEQSLDVEQRKFLNGMSSNFVIAQRQEELAQARLAEAAALIEHTKAMLELQRATGTLLQSRNVQLVLTPRNRH
jgi:outer membrane protein TolC